MEKAASNPAEAEDPSAGAGPGRPIVGQARHRWSAGGPIARRQFARLVAGSGLLALFSSVAAAEEAGAVTALSGEGRAARSGGTQLLSVGAPVFVGDTIETAEAARLAMLLGTDTRIHLGGRARLRIDKFVARRGGVLTLGTGAMLFDGPEGGGATEVLAPFGKLAVRGTRFFAGPSQGRFSVFVARGAVDVSSADRTVSLRPGEGTDFEGLGAPPRAPVAWSEGRIREALASVL